MIENIEEYGGDMKFIYRLVRNGYDTDEIALPEVREETLAILLAKINELVDVVNSLTISEE